MQVFHAYGAQAKPEFHNIVQRWAYGHEAYFYAIIAFIAVAFIGFAICWHRKNETKSIATFIALTVTGLTLSAFLYFTAFYPPVSAGEWGDLIGGLFAGPALIWFVVAVFLQMRELNLQRQTLNDQLRQSEIQSQALVYSGRNSMLDMIARLVDWNEKRLKAIENISFQILRNYAENKKPINSQPSSAEEITEKINIYIISGEIVYVSELHNEKFTISPDIFIEELLKEKHLFSSFVYNKHMLSTFYNVIKEISCINEAAVISSSRHSDWLIHLIVIIFDKIDARSEV